MPASAFTSLLFALAGLLANATRSDPVGVYAVIDKVVLAPDATTPSTIQIWGTFSLSERAPGDHYGPPVKGYLYYMINPSNERASRAEWADLQRVAGSKVIVGFSVKWQENPGRLRCSMEPPSKPDLYLLGNGIVKADVAPHSGWPIAKALLGGSATEAKCVTGK